MVYLQTTYELCFGEAYFEYFESCDFSRENTNIDASVIMFDLRMINMSSLTRHQTSYSGSPGWYFRHQSIHIQITYSYSTVWLTNELHQYFKRNKYINITKFHSKNRCSISLNVIANCKYTGGHTGQQCWYSIFNIKY